MNLIHYKALHFGDWSSDTYNMTNQQIGIFITLMLTYFGNATANNGKLDASDFDMLCWQAGCHSDGEIADLKLILKAKFKKIGSTYRNAKWDKEIKAIVWHIKNGGNTGNIQGNTGNVDGNTQGNVIGNTLGNMGNTQGNVIGNAPLTAYERKTKSNAKRAKILAELADIGVVPPDDLKMKALETLYKAHFGRDFTDGGNTQGNKKGNTGNVDGNTQGNTGNAQKSPNNHKPITNNHKPITKESEYAPTPTQTNFADEKNSQDPSENQPTGKTSSSAKKSKSSAKVAFDPKAYPIGDSVDYELWCDFVDMRKSIKKPLTEYACKLLVKEFNEWNNEGLSANKAISESIKNSWQGVFREKAVIDVPQATFANQNPTWQNHKAPANNFAQYADMYPTDFYSRNNPSPSTLPPAQGVIINGEIA